MSATEPTFTIGEKIDLGDAGCTVLAPAPGYRLHYDGGWRAWYEGDPVTNPGGIQICVYDTSKLVSLGWAVVVEHSNGSEWAPPPPQAMPGELADFWLGIGDEPDRVSEFAREVTSAVQAGGYYVEIRPQHGPVHYEVSSDAAEDAGLDQELAMAQLAVLALDVLDEEARTRVASWLFERCVPGAVAQ